jgi:hypothetical protein
MSENTQGANAAASITKPVGHNMTVGDYAAFRRESLLAKAPVAEPVTPVDEAAPPVVDEEQQQSAEDEAPEAQADGAAPPAEEQQVVLSELNLDEMSPDEIDELAKKLSSKAVARYGELTAKRKQAEAEIARLKAELEGSKNPLQREEPHEDNPFRDVKSVEDLQAKWTQMKEVVDWAEDLLDANDDRAADDVIVELNGTEFTKRDVKARKRQAQKAMESYLPQQLQAVQKRQQAEQLRTHLDSQLRQELPWMEGDDNDARKLFESVRDDPRTQKLTELVADQLPEVAAQLDYILAHFSNSLYQIQHRPAKPAAKTVNAKPNLQVNPAAGAAPNTREVSQAKALKELTERFAKSGSMGDFKALRAAQLSKR